MPSSAAFVISVFLSSFPVCQGSFTSLKTSLTDASESIAVEQDVLHTTALTTVQRQRNLLSTYNQDSENKLALEVEKFVKEHTINNKKRYFDVALASDTPPTTLLFIDAPNIARFTVNGKTDMKLLSRVVLHAKTQFMLNAAKHKNERERLALSGEPELFVFLVFADGTVFEKEFLSLDAGWKLTEAGREEERRSKVGVLRYFPSMEEQWGTQTREIDYEPVDLFMLRIAAKFAAARKTVFVRTETTGDSDSAVLAGTSIETSLQMKSKAFNIGFLSVDGFKNKIYSKPLQTIGENGGGRWWLSVSEWGKSSIVMPDQIFVPSITNSTHNGNRNGSKNVSENKHVLDLQNLLQKRRSLLSKKIPVDVKLNQMYGSDVLESLLRLLVQLEASLVSHPCRFEMESKEILEILGELVKKLGESCWTHQETLSLALVLDSIHSLIVKEGLTGWIATIQIHDKLSMLCLQMRSMESGDRRGGSSTGEEASRGETSAEGEGSEEQGGEEESRSENDSQANVGSAEPSQENDGDIIEDDFEDFDLAAYDPKKIHRNFLLKKGLLHESPAASSSSSSSSTTHRPREKSSKEKPLKIVSGVVEKSEKQIQREKEELIRLAAKQEKEQNEQLFGQLDVATGKTGKITRAQQIKDAALELERRETKRKEDGRKDQEERLRKLEADRIEAKRRREEAKKSHKDQNNVEDRTGNTEQQQQFSSSSQQTSQQTNNSEKKVAFSKEDLRDYWKSRKVSVQDRVEYQNLLVTQHGSTKAIPYLTKPFLKNNMKNSINGRTSTGEDGSGKIDKSTLLDFLNKSILDLPGVAPEGQGSDIPFVLAWKMLPFIIASTFSIDRVVSDTVLRMYNWFLGRIRETDENQEHILGVDDNKKDDNKGDKKTPPTNIEKALYTFIHGLLEVDKLKVDSSSARTNFGNKKQDELAESIISTARDIICALHERKLIPKSSSSPNCSTSQSLSLRQQVEKVVEKVKHNCLERIQKEMNRNLRRSESRKSMIASSEYMGTFVWEIFAGVENMLKTALASSELEHQEEYGKPGGKETGKGQGKSQHQNMNIKKNQNNNKAVEQLKIIKKKSTRGTSYSSIDGNTKIIIRSMRQILEVLGNLTDNPGSLASTNNLSMMLINICTPTVINMLVISSFIPVRAYLFNCDQRIDQQHDEQINTASLSTSVQQVLRDSLSQYLPPIIASILSAFTAISCNLVLSDAKKYDEIFNNESETPFPERFSRITKRWNEHLGGLATGVLIIVWIYDHNFSTQESQSSSSQEVMSMSSFNLSLILIEMILTAFVLVNSVYHLWLTGDVLHDKQIVERKAGSLLMQLYKCLDEDDVTEYLIGNSDGKRTSGEDNGTSSGGSRHEGAARHEGAGVGDDKVMLRSSPSPEELVAILVGDYDKKETIAVIREVTIFLKKICPGFCQNFQGIEIDGDLGAEDQRDRAMARFREWNLGCQKDEELIDVNGRDRFKAIKTMGEEIKMSMLKDGEGGEKDGEEDVELADVMREDSMREDEEGHCLVW